MTYHPYGERYQNLSDSAIRNAATPRNEAEAALKEHIVAQTARDILSKYENEPNFKKALTAEMARREWGTE